MAFGAERTLIINCLPTCFFCNTVITIDSTLTPRPVTPLHTSPETAWWPNLLWRYTQVVKHLDDRFRSDVTHKSWNSLMTKSTLTLHASRETSRWPIPLWRYTQVLKPPLWRLILHWRYSQVLKQPGDDWFYTDVTHKSWNSLVTTDSTLTLLTSAETAETAW